MNNVSLDRPLAVRKLAWVCLLVTWSACGSDQQLPSNEAILDAYRRSGFRIEHVKERGDARLEFVVDSIYAIAVNRLADAEAAQADYERIQRGIAGESDDPSGIGAYLAERTFRFAILHKNGVFQVLIAKENYENTPFVDEVIEELQNIFTTL